MGGKVWEILVATGGPCHVYFNNTGEKLSCWRIEGAFAIVGNRNVIHYGVSRYNIIDSWRKINGALSRIVPMCGWDSWDSFFTIIIMKYIQIGYEGFRRGHDLWDSFLTTIIMNYIEIGYGRLIHC